MCCGEAVWQGTEGVPGLDMRSYHVLMVGGLLATAEARVIKARDRQHPLPT